MKRGSTNGTTKVARVKQAAGRTAPDNVQRPDKPVVPIRAQRVRVRTKPATTSKPSSDTGNSSITSEPAATDTHKEVRNTAAPKPKASKLAAKRLTPASVERLREQPVQQPKPLTGTSGTTFAKPRQDAAVAGYDFGYESGWAAGLQSRDNLRSTLRIFQVITYILAAILILIVVF